MIFSFTPSATDVELADKLGAAPAKEYANIVRWFKHISSFDKAEKAKWGKASTSGDADDEEDIDLFGSSDEEVGACEIEEGYCSHCRMTKRRRSSSKSVSLPTLPRRLRVRSLISCFFL